MADEVKTVETTPAPAPSTTSTSAPATSDFKMPEKFTGKSAEDIARAYVEVEKKLGSRDEWAQLAELGTGGQKATPEQIRQAIEWARNTAGKINKGELVDASQVRHQAPTPPPATPQNPWEASDWEFKTAAEQSKAMADYVTGKTREYVNQVANQYGEQFNQFRTQQGTESSIMLDAITRGIKSGKDPVEIMTLAANLKSKTPQELMDMALVNLTADADREAEISKRVAEAMAVERQKMDNERLNLESGEPSGKPRFVSKNKPSDVNKQIIETLRKKGIRI